METRDFTDRTGKTVERLDAVKEVLDQFLQQREGDRVGLIVFGNSAFIQVPFTEDLSACRELLAQTAVRMAGPRTALGDAIGLGITLFERSEVSDRIMIALTDGNDTGSRVAPGIASEIAADNEVVIHVVGIGDPTAAGEEALDEETLEQMASATGGRYFHGENRKELGEIYAEIDRISARDIETQTYRPKRDLFHIPLAGAFAVSMITCLVPRE